MIKLQQTNFDLAIVGGGIVGLALAYQALRKGEKVILFERNPQALGASIRNFGMVWPIGQAAITFDRAMRSRETWLDLAHKAGFWAKPWGSLHLAYKKDEVHVMDEFLSTTKHVGYQCTLLNPEDAVEKSQAINPVGLSAALYSTTEVNIDPREAIQKLHQYFQAELGLHIQYNTVITHVAFPYLSSATDEWKAERIFICGGADFETLYPELFEKSPLTKCKLQMLRTVKQPNGWKLGPNLAAGLTLQHYAAFAHCESLQALKHRFSKEMPEYNKWGIHVLLSQSSNNELTIGDSHEYGPSPSPFDKQFINDLIMTYLKRFVKGPDLTIAETWNGVYAKNPKQTEYLVSPEENVTIVNGLGGAGMTLSFGLAQELLEEGTEKVIQKSLNL